MSLVALRLNKETIEDIDEVAEECNWSRSQVIKSNWVIFTEVCRQ